MKPNEADYAAADESFKIINAYFLLCLPQMRGMIRTHLAFAMMRYRLATLGKAAEAANHSGSYLHGNPMYGGAAVQLSVENIRKLADEGCPDA